MGHMVQQSHGQVYQAVFSPESELSAVGVHVLTATDNGTAINQNTLDAPGDESGQRRTIGVEQSGQGRHINTNRDHARKPSSPRKFRGLDGFRFYSQELGSAGHSPAFSNKEAS